MSKSLQVLISVGKDVAASCGMFVDGDGDV